MSSVVEIRNLPRVQLETQEGKIDIKRERERERERRAKSKKSTRSFYSLFDRRSCANITMQKQSGKYIMHFRGEIAVSERNIRVECRGQIVQ